MERLATRDYELYASTPALLAAAQPELEVAARTFHKYFGDDSLKIAVVVFSTAGDLASFDQRPLRARGFRVLSWLGEGAQPSIASVIQPVRLVISQKGDAAVVLALLPGSPAGIATGDTIVSIGGHAVGKTRDADDVLMDLHTGDSTRVAWRHGGQVQESWIPIKASLGIVQRSDAPSTPRDMAGSAQTDEHRALSHEACHVFLMAYVDREYRKAGRQRPPSTSPMYGDPALPDWIDEGVATLCEPAPMQGARLNYLKKHFDKRLSLTELFSMEHPIFAMLRQSGVISSRADSGHASVRTMSLPADLGERPVLFYSQANSVMRFLMSRAGDDTKAMSRLVAMTVAGETMEAFLRTLPHGPNTTDDADYAWSQWAQSLSS